MLGLELTLSESTRASMPATEDTRLVGTSKPMSLNEIASYLKQVRNLLALMARVMGASESDVNTALNG